MPKLTMAPMIKNDQLKMQCFDKLIKSSRFSRSIYLQLVIKAHEDEQLTIKGPSFSFVLELDLSNIMLPVHVFP